MSTGNAQCRSITAARLGPLRLSAGYLVGPRGGDVHGAVATPFGVRLFIGDVVGRGPLAAETAEAVFTAWCGLARYERSLKAIALRLHSLMTMSLHAEEFVTAQLVTVADDGSAELVCCGHPPPLLISGGRAVFAAVPDPAPPLGLLDLSDGWVTADPLPFGPGDHLLLYTDGVTEARNAAGEFYPLRDRVAKLADSDPRDFRTALEADLLAHTGGRLEDDAALLLAEFEPTG
jgi:serine phosphatase RsbU (regulator of sigma subunit)